MPNLQSRVKSLQSILEDSFYDAAVMASTNDIFYYTGHRISGSGLLVVDTISSKPKLLVTTLDNFAEDLKSCSVSFISSADDIKKVIGFYEKICFDEGSMKASTYLKIKTDVFKPEADLIKKPRLVKDSFEIEQIKKSIAVIGNVFKGLRISGKTEADVSMDVLRKLIDMGSAPSFDPLITAGTNSSFVHHIPEKKKITAASPTIVDIGAMYGGYCSDVTRMHVPRDKKSRRIYEDVTDLQAFLIDNVEPGKTFDYVNSLYDKFLREKGYSVMHSFGHGVGLNVHERPFGKDKLEPGMVLTVEPGIYIKNKAGFRVEDMVLVGKQKPTVLSKAIRQELA